jgi:hypothetical protein
MTVGAMAVGAMAVEAMAVGAPSVGATTVGAMAVGARAVGADPDDAVEPLPDRLRPADGRAGHLAAGRAWARVTIGHVRRAALQTLYGHISCTNILLAHS